MIGPIVGQEAGSGEDTGRLGLSFPDPPKDGRWLEMGQSEAMGESQPSANGKLVPKGGLLGGAGVQPMGGEGRGGPAAAAATARGCLVTAGHRPLPAPPPVQGPGPGLWASSTRGPLGRAPPPQGLLAPFGLWKP